MQVQKENLEYLKTLKANNNRDWFNDHKKEFKRHQTNLKRVFETIFSSLKEHDQVDSFKVFRIYRDIRFSKNKTPYKTHFSASYHRSKPELRGGYYVHIEPNDKSFIAVGFWNPEKDDLFRIRQELAADASEFKEIVSSKIFVDHWGDLKGDELKTAPRDFDKDHEDIHLIRKKQYIFTKQFSDTEVLSTKFLASVDNHFRAVRPFFDYMSEVLTTDVNGQSII
ncbi:MAG: DUF2461 domain-containing protein [Flavobacteriaceae bacterium]|nr:DUF2461 domain-containing protein [Flavobacteriaceae bacterium]